MSRFQCYTRCMYIIQDATSKLNNNNKINWISNTEVLMRKSLSKSCFHGQLNIYVTIKFIIFK